VAPEARLEVDGQPINLQPKRYLLLNKPRGPISTVTDARGRRTVLDLLPAGKDRLYPTGRLDADTEGLLLITNDGDLTYRLTHPRYGVPKTYEAEIEGRLTVSQQQRLARGLTLEEGPTGPATVRVLRDDARASLVEITVHAGRKRMVRRMFEVVGNPVRALKRTRLGPLTLGQLAPGEWRELTEAEVEQLRAATERDAAPHRGGAEQ
jgi:23S rRNA pseudouridine2605 synthase